MVNVFDTYKLIPAAMTDHTIHLDSPKQASQILEEPVANRSSFSEVVNRMCHNFHLKNCGVKSSFTCEKLLNWLHSKSASPETAKFDRVVLLRASVR